MHDADEKRVGEQRAIAKECEANERLRDAKLSSHEERAADEARSKCAEIAGLENVERARRVDFAAFLQRDDAEWHAEEQQQHGDRINRAVSALDVGGTRVDRERNRGDCDREVHIKHPAPTRKLCDEATEDGTDGEESHRDADVDAHRFAALAWREVFNHERRACRLHERGAEALEDSSRE